MTKSISSVATPTVHLIGPGKIKVLNGRLAFSTGQGTPTRLDPQQLEQIVCYGPVGISDDAFAMLFQHEVQVSWMSGRGNRFRGRLARVVDSAVVLRGLQHKALGHPVTKLAMARQIVGDKIRSQLELAKHYQQHGAAAATRFLADNKQRVADVEASKSLDVLRGLEGITSKGWFELLGKLLKSPWSLPGRVRRPPTDPVNALLSLGYTWLANKTAARIQAAGLELALGALHEFRPGRPSLACDLMEPLRAPIVDRWVLRLCNRSSVAPADFQQQEGRGVRLTPDRFPDVLTRWETHWLRVDGPRQLDKQINSFVSDLRRLGKDELDQDGRQKNG